MMRTLTPVFSIVIALVAFFFYTQPKYDGTTSIESDITEYNKAVDTAQKLNTLIQNLLNEKNTHSQAELVKLDKIVPQEVDEVRLIVDLKNMAKHYNMLFGNIEVSSEPVDTSKLTSATVSDAIGADSFVTSDISFSLIGTYDQFKSMLYDIERSMTILDVTNLSIAASEGTLQQFNITVRAYSLPRISQ